VCIFVLSVSGNSLVALTIAQNRRMRTLTNVLLMNLSVADLLLAVFCMPFTLIPTLLQNFIFGPVVCVLVRYMQGELAASLLATRSLAESHEMTVICVEVLHYFVKILQGASLALSIPLTHHGCCYRSD